MKPTNLRNKKRRTAYPVYSYFHLAPMEIRPPDSIPITVFTGFLGAGKTSIILSLLPKLPKDYKAVLLKNEFGDIEGVLPSPLLVIACHILSAISLQWTVN